MQPKQCTVYGYLYGAICDDLRVWDRIGGAQIVAVSSDQNQPSVDSLARANRGATKLAVSDIDEARFKSVSADALMRDTTGRDGAFCFDNPDYQGGLIDLYVRIDRIPAPTLDQGYVELEEPCYLFLGTYQPFRTSDAWYLIVVIPSVVWCRIRRKADLWVIIGRVTPCDDTGIGLGGLTVTAKDADIVQHDVLGSAVTNAGGIFRIDYPGDLFRQGTWLDVELFGGPDVYFEIKDGDGNVLLDESPLRGRQGDRCDRRPCFCVRLCVAVDVPPVGPIPSIWTNVGTAFTIPDAGGLNDFDADGYAGASRYAFHGAIRLLGSAPLTTSGGNPVEYRFLVSDAPTSNGGAPPPLGTFTRIVGAGADAGLFASTLVGQMIRYSPFKVVNVVAIQADLDGDGWLDVETSINRTFATHPTLTPADIPDFVWLDSDALMAINTQALTSEPDVPIGVGDPGDPVPPANRIAIEQNAIRFEIREVVDKPSAIFNTMPGSGTTLNSIVVNNNVAYMKVAMAEHLAGAKCDIISVPPHVAYTAYHPHVADVGITIRSNDFPDPGSYNASISDGTIPIAGNTNPAVNHANNAGAAVPLSDPGGDPLKKCSYIVTLRVLRRLHTGDGAAPASFEQTSFYYEP